MQGAGFRVQGSGCRVQGAGCRVQGAGCRVQGAHTRRLAAIRVERREPGCVLLFVYATAAWFGSWGLGVWGLGIFMDTSVYVCIHTYIERSERERGVDMAAGGHTCRAF